MKRAGLLELRSNQARLIFLCVLLHVGEPIDLWPDTGVRSVPPPFNSTSLRKTLDWTLSRVGMSVESFGWLHIDCSKLNFVGFEQHATAVSWCNWLIRWAVSWYTLEQGRRIPIRALQQFNFSVRFWKKKYQYLPEQWSTYYFCFNSCLRFLLKACLHRRDLPPNLLQANRFTLCHSVVFNCRISWHHGGLCVGVCKAYCGINSL